MASDGDAANTITLLFTTDNHVGYEENDMVRGNDAALAFDESLALANEHMADAVLQGGDLFHINRPSRKSLFDVMRSLRRHCFGDNPIALECLSHGPLTPDADFDHLNYQDPNLNVSLPVFAVSGNHDDAGGMAGVGTVAPMDVLAAAGLLNHFGSIPNNDDIVVEPILIRKGNTKLALYGLASVRDERMHRAFRDGKVKFLRPAQDAGSYYSILCIHQNRAAHSPTNFIPERFLPAFLDLVLWGHEHDSRPALEHNPERGFAVLQIGSTVATSLSEGETLQKHVALLKIRNREMKMTPIPLRSVRPFAMSTISLLDMLTPSRNTKHEATKIIMNEIDRLIETHTLQQGENTTLPLIRVRVEYTDDYELENPRRISNLYEGRVANVNDIVAFSRKQREQTKETKKRGTDQSRNAAVAASEALEKLELSTLVKEYLQNQTLSVLPEEGMDEAVGRFVDKEDKGALAEFVGSALAEDLHVKLEIDENRARLLVNSAAPAPTVPAKRGAKTVAAKAAPKSTTVGVAARARTTKTAKSMPVVIDEATPKRARTTRTAAAAPTRRAPARTAAANASTAVHDIVMLDGGLDSDDGFS